jgi:hypothetical protein
MKAAQKRGMTILVKYRLPCVVWLVQVASTANNTLNHQIDFTQEYSCFFSCGRGAGKYNAKGFTQLGIKNLNDSRICKLCQVIFRSISVK